MTDVLLRHRTAARLALTEAASSPKTRRALGQGYARLAKLMGTRLSRAGDGEAAGWAIVGALAIHVQRWAVFGELDDRGLERWLAMTARVLIAIHQGAG